MDQTTYFIDRKKKLEDEIKRAEKKLASMPAETLVYHRQIKNGKSYITYFKQSFINGERIRTLLTRKKNMREAKLLAQKMYLSKALSDKKNELKCIEFYLKHRKNENYSDMLGPDSPYRELLVVQNTIADEWEYAPYEKSHDHPEHLTVPAPKGEMVRSKSEAAIAQSLFNHKIPYRYEEIHDIYGSLIATDFTILHPKTHKIFLWEHFGRCDDPGYQGTVDYKMYRYIRAGYLPGRTMITTYEDSSHPFVYLDAEEVVQRFFL